MDKTPTTATTSRHKLEATKPVRGNFKTQEEFEEAYGYWMSHAGRILGMTRTSSDSQPPSKSTAKP